MRWGVRKTEKKKATTIKRINTMYNRSNKWANRKIEKLDRKGKTAKADVMREMVKQNSRAQKDKTNAIKNMSETELRKTRRTDLKDVMFGGQRFMDRNKSMMSTPLNRYDEYVTQRGMRWASNFTLNSTLARMSAKEGYRYLDNKVRYNLGYASAQS